MEHYSGAEIKDHEVLDKEEERELIQKAQEGDEGAKNSLIEHNQKMTGDFAYEMRCKYNLPEDREDDISGRDKRPLKSYRTV